MVVRGRRWTAGAIGLAGGIVLAAWSQATAQTHQTFPDTFQTAYYDIATSASASAGGYGGPGSSGGAGDNIVRIINTTIGNGVVCAMIYVFDDFAQMQACCGCPVIPNGMRSLSALNDLTVNFGVNAGDSNAGMIRIVGSTLNFTPGMVSPTPLPPGTNGCTGSPSDSNCSAVSAIPAACSPTGSVSTDGRSAALNPTSGLRSRITHNELAAPGIVSGGMTLQGLSVEAFQNWPLDTDEINALQQGCQSLITSVSGPAFCTCGAGSNKIASGKQAPRRARSTRRHQ